MPSALRVVTDEIGFAFESTSGLLSNEEVFAGLVADEGLALCLTETLQQSRHSAFFWECAPVTTASTGAPFRFVVLNSRDLTRVTADPTPFASKIRSVNPVETFANLGRDAVLVVPTAQGELNHYAHLAKFVRKAPADQIRALWAAVGAAAMTWLKGRPEPLWLSTSGLGVHWLHVRLDSQPKYYSHGPFRELR